MSLGFKNAGIDIVAAFEFWDVAATCYGDNFDHPVFKTDLSNVEMAVKQIKAFSPQLIIGGPPCQDFSHAGKRVEASRASLTESYAKIVSQVTPQFFVMENVDRAEQSNAFKHARQIFKDSGYGITQIVLDASKCGVPQKRKRFFCIGQLNQEDNFLLKRLTEGLSEKEMTLRDYFGDTLDFEFYYRHPRNYSRRAIFSIDEPAPTMRGMNRPVPKGYPGHPNDACKLSENIRALTTLERSLIQTFPASFKWSGNKTDTEQMIGNAVPVKLAEYVANTLLNYINEENNIETNEKNFEKWLSESKTFSSRSARDTISRVRRANKFCKINGTPSDIYIYKLQQTDAFLALSTSVKSQIKRSVLLYFEYINCSTR